MPYPNEHSCRLLTPNLFTAFRRKNEAEESEGRRIDVIYGIKKGKTKIQALRYPISVWSEMEAAIHCGERGGEFHSAEPPVPEKAIPWRVSGL